MALGTYRVLRLFMIDFMLVFKDFDLFIEAVGLVWPEENGHHRIQDTNDRITEKKSGVRHFFEEPQLIENEEDDEGELEGTRDESCCSSFPCGKKIR